MLDGLGLHADTSVLNLNRQVYASVVTFFVRHCEVDGSFFGVFNGVGKNVHKNLLDSYFVSHNLSRDFFVYIYVERKAFVCRTDTCHVDDILKHVDKVKRDRHKLHLSRLYL